jgi:hypothetical protein
MDSQDKASEYSKFPKHGHRAEKKRADRKELFVYQKEYRKAANMAARDEAPTRVAPKAPSVPSAIA